MAQLNLKRPLLQLLSLHDRKALLVFAQAKANDV